MEQPKINKKERNMNKHFKIQEILKNIERKDCLLLPTPVFQPPNTPPTPVTNFLFQQKWQFYTVCFLLFFTLNTLWNPFFFFQQHKYSIITKSSTDSTWTDYSLGYLKQWSHKQSCKYIILYVCKHMLIYS